MNGKSKTKAAENSLNKFEINKNKMAAGIDLIKILKYL